VIDPVALRRRFQSDPLAIRLRPVCARALACDRRRRFESADEFLQALDEAADTRLTSRRWLMAGAILGTLFLGHDRPLVGTARAEVLIVQNKVERPLSGAPQLRLGDQIAFAFDTAGATADLAVRLPSGTVVCLEPFRRGATGLFRYPPQGGTVLRQERGIYVVFFSAKEDARPVDHLLRRLEQLPPPPALRRGVHVVLSGDAENGLPGSSHETGAWAEAVLQCEREFPGLVAIAFPVE